VRLRTGIPGARAGRGREAVSELERPRRKRSGCTASALSVIASIS
jgi:hypothetical protein